MTIVKILFERKGRELSCSEQIWGTCYRKGDEGRNFVDDNPTKKKKIVSNENNEWNKNLIFKRVLTESSKRLEWNVRGFEKWYALKKMKMEIVRKIPSIEIGSLHCSNIYM